MSSNKPTVRLPNLRTLRVKYTAPDKTGSCTIVMTNLLNCWASNAEGAPACKGIEQELKSCMATKVSGYEEKIREGGGLGSYVLIFSITKLHLQRLLSIIMLLDF